MQTSPLHFILRLRIFFPIVLFRLISLRLGGGKVFIWYGDI